MTNLEIVNFLDACLKESTDVNQERKAVMAECYDRYRSFRDYSKKKPWQHKIVAPTVYPAIKGAAGLLRRILMKSDEFFKFVPERQDNAPNQIDPMTGQPAQDMMDNFSRAFTRKVRFHLDEAEFIEKFGEGVESALAIMMGVLKFTPKLGRDTRVIWGPVPLQGPDGQPLMSQNGQPVIEKYDFLREESTRGKLQIDVVNPLLLHFPEDMSWIVEETRVQLHELLENEEQIPWDKRELNRMKREDYVSPADSEDEQKRLKMLRIKEHKNEFRREVVLHTYWGTVTERNGKVVVKDGRFIVANRKYVILPPSPSPHWLRKHPYVFITPLKVLFQAIGAGMVDGVRPIINAIDNLVNIAGDKALYALLPPSEINVDALKDPQQAEGGLTPGKLFKTKGPLGQALRQTQAGDIPQGTFVLTEMLRKFVQNYTGWTEFMQGSPTQKGTVTATEVERKTEASSLSFENIAASIEKCAVIESVEIARDLVVQYLMDPALNPETEDMFSQEKIALSMLPEPERYAFINKRYPIKVKGLTAFFDREKERKDMIDFVGIIAQVPALAARLNLEEFLMRLVTGFEWRNPEQLIITGMPNVPMQIDPTTGKPIPASPMPALPAGAPGMAAPGNPQQILDAMIKGGGIPPS